MGRWKYDWHIQYYSSGGWIRDYYTTAKTKEEAFKNLRKTGAIVIEVICCRRIDLW